MRIIPPAPIDLEPREGRPETGWPFDLEALMPYLRRAHDLFDAGPFAYDVGAWSLRAPPFPRDGTRLAMRGARYVPATVFTRDLKTLMAASSRVDVILHATATRLEMDDRRGRVAAIQATGPGGRSFAVRARNFVLATGGLENARILLLSGRGQPRSIGNGARLVGRYFMDHPNLLLGTLVPTQLALEAWAVHDLQYVDGYPVRADLVPGDTVMREERLPDAVFTLAPRPRWRDSAAVLAAARVASSLRHRRRPAIRAGDLGALVTHPRDLVAVAWYRGVRRVPRLWKDPWGWSRAPQYANLFNGFTVRAETE